jgi:hypothetical protein
VTEKTGWPVPALMQDGHRGLFRWFASKPDARRLVRESAERIKMTLRHSVPTNHNPDTGIAYGYISANALDPDIVNDLQMSGDDVYFKDVLEEAQRELAREPDIQKEALADAERSAFSDEDDEFDTTLAYIKANWEGSQWEQEFNDSYQPDEPIHEGVKYVNAGYPTASCAVKYRTSWLGGALNVFITESPYITETAVECSLCVPGAGNLDQVGEGSYRCYDVPPEWRWKED